MIDERAFLSELSRLGPDQLLPRIRHADVDEQRVLQIYFGAEQYAALQRLAMRAPEVRGGPPKGNVVVLHGIMGGELTLFSAGGQERIWINVLHLIQGYFDKLALDDVSGLSAQDVRASGLYMKYYAGQIASLVEDWTVRPFFYDWRRDIRQSADDLARCIDSWFGPAAPVHLVAHSMGGLVARSFISRHPERWKSMAGDKLEQGGRLVMLGTPNYGSFAIPRLLFGHNDVLDVLIKINITHLLDRAYLLKTIRTFEGAYQMLPVRDKLNGLDVLYRAATYTSVPIRQGHLDNAEEFQRQISGAIDKDRMVYVAGYNRSTFCGILNAAELANDGGYAITMRGDGTVPHLLGLIDGVKTFYVDEEHAKLPGNERVCRAMTELLQTGSQRDETNLYFGLAAEIRGAELEDQTALHAAETGRRRERQDQALVLVNHLQRRGAVNSNVITPEEQALADLLLSHQTVERGLSASPDASQATSAGTSAGTAAPAVIPISLRVAVRVDRIEKMEVNAAVPFPIDAIAVGHYMGVRPSGAEWALDAAITPHWAGNADSSSTVLVQFHDRGILVGTLGQPFFLPDPRPGNERVLLVVMGMGQIGSFGIPELAVVVRELAYSLAQLGKTHLASVLIGASRENLSVRDALHAFLLGLQRTLTEAVQGNIPHLKQITLVAQRHEAGVEIARALKLEAESLKQKGFNIEMDIPPDIFAAAASEKTDSRGAEPVRIALEIEEGALKIAAFTKSASAPERNVALNSSRLMDLSRQLIDEVDPTRRLRLGQYLLMYLLPQDIRGGLSGSQPIVLSCNNAAAQIPWELAALRPEAAIGDAGDQPYLGLLRGVTRQLRTTMAPPPEPPPPAARNLRVLLVADTSREHPLPGAQHEADSLLELFKKINEANAAKGRKEYVHCTSLMGPANASLLNVLIEINTSDPYDVLHYAGHCFFDKDHPEKSGYLFSGGDALTADDLQRVDRVPKFIFSNACESGVLPSRADQASRGLAPAFAESFFGRGVANFVCTAWPISDEDACKFAVTLYSCLLGLDGNPDVMWRALCTARKSIVGNTRAGHTWGAYQHYGNPFFRLFR